MIGRLRRFDASLAEPLEQLGARALGIVRHGAQLRGYAATRLRSYSALRAVTSGRHAPSPTNPSDTLQSEEWLRSDVATDSWRKTVPTKEKACRSIRKTL